MIIQNHIPLADKTWFNTGGNAHFFTQPTTPEDFCNALMFAQRHNLETFILGKGANILVSDNGFNGMVIQPQLSNITILPSNASTLYVKAGAGVCIQDLITHCLNHNLIGLEEFSGIPGTVGGSVYINIHYFEFLLSQFLVKASVIHKKTGKLHSVDNRWFRFGYDQSKLQEGSYYLVDATFKLTQANATQAAYAQGRRDEIIRHRTRRYPTKNTCGSFFRNFTKEELRSMNPKHSLPYVAYYLDLLGIKGKLRRGGAHVSAQHANMIVTNETGTSADVIAVARNMQEQMLDTFGLLPQPECQLIGFDHHPLL